ncbi:uncharacterized protein F4807DRAFT_467398 [Annulohypoxylon truncatum]|uniref:uncharacterized protein n=1 Tax=Annulohypoxylon truncatum TaxID=327061 RepID=UPI00200868F7|nr:uncharacterized protein F4807DRAFT_467398 [Annulohypoxylon truncatum]KAI1209865.1 hypothetical protein F4807DRAFT_467398 [Annulohypoxylon truncatum]
MRPYTIFALLFSHILLASPITNAHVIPQNAHAEALGPATNISSLLLEKRDEIDDWNNNHPENRIAAWYICPDPRVLYTVFNAASIWQAFNRGVWFSQHTNEARPRWSGVEFPHTILLEQYRAQRVDLGRVDGEIYLFPLDPGPLGEWPGLPGSPVTGPPGQHRVVFDERGVFAGVAVLFTGEAEGVRLVWCYPMLEYGARDVGATAEGNTGVDEAWRDAYDGLHYLYAPDPAGGSRPPSPRG